MTFYYTVIIKGDIEPEVIGPFEHAYLADLQALALKKKYGDEHGIFYMDFDEDGHVDLESFSMKFMDVEGNDYLLIYTPHLDYPILQHIRKGSTNEEVEALVKDYYSDAERWEWLDKFPEALA